MAIQAAGGTIVDTTVAGDTRLLIVDNLKTQLVNAGWTASGSSGNWTMTSATTPASLACKVVLFDPGSGSCARITFQDTAGLAVQTTAIFMLPGAAKVFRIIANKYQFFMYTPGATGAREFAAGGVPYIDTTNILTPAPSAVIWACGMGTSDGDTTIRNTFRNVLVCGSPNGSFSPNNYVNYNGFFYTSVGQAAAGGNLQLLAAGPAVWNIANVGKRWHNNRGNVFEPLLMWGVSSVSDEGKIGGQLWDAILWSMDEPADNTFSYGGRTYRVVTNGNVGSNQTYAPGTLCLAVT